MSSRRGFLAALGSAAAAAGAGPQVRAAIPDNSAKAERGITPPSQGEGHGRALIEPFAGDHQGGIATALQSHTYMLAFDLTTKSVEDVVRLMKLWTLAAARMTAGETAAPLDTDRSAPAADSGDALGLAPARLTVTFGFGPGLFMSAEQDRYGLAAYRPEALVDLPPFTGDQLQEARTGGDLSVQACADDPQVAFHAARQLARLAQGIAQIRWAQTGFAANFAAEETPRNLMGFKDGTQNPIARKPLEKTAETGVRSNPGSLEDVVWVAEEGPDWMQGGSYMVVRRIRIALEHWDATPVDFQEETIGRHKDSGAPIGGTSEFDPLDLDATDADGNPLIAEHAHVRMAAAASNDGAEMLRRSYSYNDGVSFTAERWPPWRQGMMYDAGLLFMCYQRDPRTSFIKIFGPMSQFDMLNQYATHVGGGLFACPGGVRPGEFIGQKLFEAALGTTAVAAVEAKPLAPHAAGDKTRY
ncbi:MAG: Dyp-type peroxidase [Acetobacteraceae bacterium]|nr:Dyp-type peroxidase [Acetobacteraceae bacterium]